MLSDQDQGTKYVSIPGLFDRPLDEIEYFVGSLNSNFLQYMYWLGSTIVSCYSYDPPVVVRSRSILRKATPDTSISVLTELLDHLEVLAPRPGIFLDIHALPNSIELEIAIDGITIIGFLEMHTDTYVSAGMATNGDVLFVATTDQEMTYLFRSVTTDSDVLCPFASDIQWSKKPTPERVVLDAS